MGLHRDDEDMDTVDVVIPTFGGITREWERLRERAIHSVYEQTAVFESGVDIRIWPTIGENLADARNRGANRGKGEWLIFLDADDELDSHYVEAMVAGTGDMRWPSTIGVHEDGHEDDYPVLLQPKGSLLVHNWMVIGTMIRREQFLKVGGFRDLPILEDWDLWIRLVIDGAVPMACPDALYRVHVRANSRNNPDIHGRTYTEIQQTYQAEWLAKGLR